MCGRTRGEGGKGAPVENVLCMLKIVYFLALKCSNRAHNELDKHMEALFFIRGSGLAYKSLFVARRQLRHLHRPICPPRRSCSRTDTLMTTGY